jgi:hypothetical protein
MRRRWAAWVWPTVAFAAIPVCALLLVWGKQHFSDNVPDNAATPLAAAQHVNTRSWRTISQDPAGHAAARVVLWGQVTQFDAPGAATFRANVDSARHAPDNGVVNYPTAVIMHGDPILLQNLVRGYIFKAEATVDGGTTDNAGPDRKATVPTLTVTKITITDKTVG